MLHPSYSSLRLQYSWRLALWLRAETQTVLLLNILPTVTKEAVTTGRPTKPSKPSKPTTAKPEKPSGDQCGSVAIFPVKDKCWKKFATENKDLCDPVFGELKDSEVSADRFTGAECGCNTKSRGDGFNCYGFCGATHRSQVTCAAGLECNTYKNGTAFCNCPFGSVKDVNGKCQKVASNCATCKHNCHMASKCRDAKDGPMSNYKCNDCDPELGFEGNGRSCFNINECESETHKCGARAVCNDKDPLYDDGKKYECVCMKGWTKNPNAGTQCMPCEDNDECVEQPDICGPNAICENTPGDHRCTCMEGYKKDLDNKCIDINECLIPGKCGTFSNCTNTPGSYECTCITGFKKANGHCEPDEAYFCKDCDKKTTECKLTPAKDAMTCECKKNHFRLDARSCSPNTYCDKADKNNCAAPERATCTDLPDGSGFNCTCKEGYEGNGRVCDAINICDRKRPCTFVSNTVCKADEKNPKEKYTCVCREGHVRQLAEQDNDKAPCFDINSNVVNNCTLCDTNTEDCVSVPGDKTGALKSCACKKGYSTGMNGRCLDKNECNPPEEHNCDTECATCVNKVFYLDKAYFACEVKKGWSGNGTLGTCQDMDECKEKNPCEGQNRECHNTRGSFKCPCVPGFREIPGVKDCVDDNECERGNFTCNDYSFCKNTVGSYECVCQNGFKEVGRDDKGKPKCENINECKEGLNGTGTPACTFPNTMCRDQKGTYDCDCKPGFRRNILKECVDINECTERLDHCDLLTTKCNNTMGSYTCDCKHGYEKIADSNTTCTNINECTSTTKPHKCNPNSSCKDLPGSYECKCDANYEPEADSHPMRPFCKRVDVCLTMKNLNCMCICQNIDKPPFYKCKCQHGSISYNDTMCITPSFCDKGGKEGAEFPCPANSDCINEKCECKPNYNWLNVDEPLSIEKIKARKGCKPDSWCEKYRSSCPPRSKCRDTGPGAGECYCPEGFVMDNDLGECLDVNECNNSTLKCPSNSKCVNLVGSYKCECDEGYTNTNTNKETKLNKPVCDLIKYCGLRLDNCTMYNNSVCHDTDPFYECKCKPGYQRNQTRGSCGAKICPPGPCSDINECLPELKLQDCDKNAICINTPGSFKCKCKTGFFGPGGKKCIDDDECDLGTHDCDLDTQDCTNLPGTFNCTCKAGFELKAGGKCEDIDECLSDTNNDCKKKDPKLRCKNTLGSYYCECSPGYVKALNNSCIDENECNASPCPAGNGNKCVNTDGDYNCTCLDGYKKDDHCETEHKTCPCVNINECEDRVQLANGTIHMPCGKEARCTDKDPLYECKCKDGYEGNPYYPGKCEKIDLCTKFPCDAESQKCTLYNKAPVCVCKEGYVPAGNGKCVKNPCLTKNGGCGKDAMCFPNPKTGEAKCNCASGKMLDEKKNCVNEDPCKCGEKRYCRSDVCDHKDLMMCYKFGSKAKCECDKGYKFDEKAKKCININECLDKPCPTIANCTDTEGSFTCNCPRGQKYDGKGCPPDVACSLEGYCRGDPNASCEKVEKDRLYCKCKEGFKGSGRPSDPLCVAVDPCVEKEAKEGKKPCTGAYEHAESSTTCQCKCDPGFERNSSAPFECVDIDECTTLQYTCKETFVCKNIIGGYECVCPEFYKLEKAKCVRDDKCSPFPCNNVTQHCDWRTGKCSCKDEFKLAPNGTCIDRNECEENTYKCMANSKCNNTFGGYECICFDGYERKGDQCVDKDECLKDVCGKIHKCENLPGSYRCHCAEGWLQYGPRDCLKNTTDQCTKCNKYAHCLMGITSNVYNCTCNLGYEGDGINNCTDIDECKLGIDNCHKLANCTNEQPLYSCKCNEPYIGDGRNVCELPDMCTTKHNNCPKDSDCKGLKEKDASSNWVTCVCKAKGTEFNNKTRKCEDIDECARCKDYANCPCPITAKKCKNTQGSFTCECGDGYKYNQAANTCDDIDECTEGSSQEKCVPGKGHCSNKPGSWDCICEPGYKNKADDKQVCEKEIFCGTKDTCEKNTTKCIDLPVGYKCECLSGLLHVPGNDKKCEDRNECKDGSHNCSLDGSELCTNTYQGFVCNCTNGYTKDDKAKKCLPDNKCSAAEAEKANCGVYSFCVNLPGKDGKPVPKCICETGYYLAEKEQVCVVVPPCKNDFDCPSNSRCQVVQAQNKTGEVGTYKCMCADGYEMKGHQCFPAEPCKGTSKICGEGVCVAKLLPPFYECQCTVGTKQDNITAPCMPQTCEGNSICTPHAECKTRPEGGIYCQCKPGYAGLGIISSPCKHINLCDSATPCSRYATCNPNGDQYTCKCNEGYSGNGTWCTNTDECADPKLNNCDGNATCTDTQGGYKCTCNKGYTGVGTKGACININECNDPASNQCEIISTKCEDTEGSYKCNCKPGYEKGNSSFACDDINECERNKTICGELHKCHNIPASYECICAPGYQLLEGSHKKTCIDIDECNLTPKPCHPNADCKNSEGSFECPCKPGYKGDGIKNCTIEDLCVPKKNKCDLKSTKCRMQSDKPAYVCECLEGFERQPGVAETCNDIDECADEKTPYDRESVNCKNLPGTYELECKDLYTAKHISANKKNITCVDKDECALDPAFAETLKKVEAGQNKGSWKEWMVAPKDNSSAYAICYFNALNNISFNSIQKSLPLADTLLPMCLNLSPKNISNMTSYDSKLKGFECTCPPPGARSYIALMKKFGFSCPSSGCPNCRTDFNYECVESKCQCKHGYSERVVNKTAQCVQRECGDGEQFPAQIIASKHTDRMDCDPTSNRWIAKTGFRLVRDNVTHVVTACVDINECKEQPDICCASESKCTGPNCVKCMNTIGSYTCGSPTIVCDVSKVDKNTCKCQEPPCPKVTAWYANCNGNPTVKDLGKDKRVCSRIFDQKSNEFMSFDNEQALFEYAVKLKCDCCFLNAKPDNFSANPVVNYYGKCEGNTALDKVVCPNGEKARETDAGPWCPLKMKVDDLPSVKIGDEVGHTLSNPTMCEPLPDFVLLSPLDGKMDMFKI